MPTVHKTTSLAIAVSAHWQVLFIAVSILGWAWPVFDIAYLYTHGGYIGTGTWIVTATTWLLPLFFLGIAFALLSSYVGLLRRLFMACLATMIGMILYAVGAGIERVLWNKFYAVSHPVSATGTSLWSAYGHDWTVMIVSLLVFTAGLYFATHKPRTQP